MSQEYFSIEEVARQLGLHAKTVRRFVAEGRLSASRVGRKWRVRRSDLDLFLARNSTSRPGISVTRGDRTVAAGIGAEGVVGRPAGPSPGRPEVIGRSATAEGPAGGVPAGPDSQEMRSAPKQDSGGEDASVSRTVTVSAVVDVDAIDTEEAMRISNTVVAALNSKDPVNGRTRYDHIYYPAERRAQYVFWGTPAFVSNMLRLLSYIGRTEGE